MKKLIFLLFFLISSISFAQINYEAGYFIDNLGVKTECFIRNVAWNKNPQVFDYKLNESSDSKTISIAEVSEFNVGNSYNYKRFKLKIDRSDNKSREPKWNEEILFLKMLVEGAANLYQFDDEEINKFFIGNGIPEKVEQLVYKEYYQYNNDDGETIEENNNFRQQLLNLLKSDMLTEKDFKNVKYEKNNLTKLFLKYNNSKSIKTVNFESKQNKSSIDLKLTGSIKNTSFSFSDEFYNYHLSPKPAIGIGIEAEIVLPFNQNKWSFFINPSFQSYQNESTTNDLLQLKVKYKFIEVPIGLRHYIFLNKKSKIFLNISFGLGFVIDSSVDITKYVTDLKIGKSTSFSTGIGYAYDKFGVEFRYNLSNNLYNTSFYAENVEYKSIGLVMSYKFL
jgi:hypothetical protein